MLADTANYHCRATNAAGQDETLARLYVLENVTVEKVEPPKFTTPLTTVFAMEKMSCAFRCIVEGHPLPIVQWYRNNVCIDQHPDYTITYNNGQATLRIEEVCPEDQTTFMCRAVNPAGTAETTANLIVHRKSIIFTWFALIIISNSTFSLENANEKPVFTQLLTNVMARVGQKLKLECEVRGKPTPHITWKQNNRPIFHPDAQVWCDPMIHVLFRLTLHSYRLCLMANVRL